ALQGGGDHVADVTVVLDEEDAPGLRVRVDELRLRGASPALGLRGHRGYWERSAGATPGAGRPARCATASTSESGWIGLWRWCCTPEASARGRSPASGPAGGD